ncbi:MAG: 2,3,4,5-tetrahydropyridine-2,6-dicarboxylate N-succinyltransferase [Bacteroidales bacterium]|nr:2,3,4,5-tetrahydropyridine-2,6-dicarboxylate N-succinyltransferase [Bacteroidales bacterium]
MMQELKGLIEKVWEERPLLSQPLYKEAVEEVIALLDRGGVRVAEPASEEEGRVLWQVNEWVKKAVLLYFSVAEMRVMEVGPYEYYDKIPLKHGLEAAGVRVVPPAVARYGSFLERGAVMMPSYVNIGARVGAGTMVDTWATVGSCAQIGSHVHLSGGVGIGGVLEPLSARPVIVEDDCFIGSRCILVEGVQIGREAVLGANVCITGSTHIVDVSGEEAKTYRGWVPPRSVVIPGTLPKTFAAGTYQVPCALIIGKRKASTDTKTTLNEALRDFSVAV